MEQDSEILNPETQCPQKPRGRKKKTSTRPSAAACGFNTEGMTDEQVQAKLESLRKETKTVKDEEGEQTKPSRKRCRTKKCEDTAAETNPKTKEKASASGTAEVKKRSKGGKKRPLTDVESDTEPKKEVRTVRSSGKKRTDQLEEDKEPKKDEQKVRSRGKKHPHSDHVEAPKKDEQKVRSNGRKRSGDEEGDEKERGKKVRRSDKTEETAKTTSKGKNKQQATASSSNQARDDDQAAAEKKKERSRKSSAYHAAKKAAKIEGLSEEKQLEAARKVPEQPYYSIFFIRHHHFKKYEGSKEWPSFNVNV